MLPFPLSNVLKTKIHHCYSIVSLLTYIRPWINLTPSEEGRFGRTDCSLQRESWEEERGNAHPVRRGTRQPQAVRWPSTITTTLTEKLISLMENRHVSYLHLLQLSCPLSILLGWEGWGHGDIWCLQEPPGWSTAEEATWKMPSSLRILPHSGSAREREELRWEDVLSRQRIPPSSFSINSASPVAQDYDQKGWILPDLLNFNIMFGGGMQHFTHMHRLPF